MIFRYEIVIQKELIYIEKYAGFLTFIVSYVRKINLARKE